jgi:hypothetical protein
MTSKEFIIWLRGFVAGSNNFNLTPQGWDTLKEELEKVSDEPKGVHIGIGGTGVLNTTGTTSVTHFNPQSGSWHYTNTMGGNGLID